MNINVTAPPAFRWSEENIERLRTILATGEKDPAVIGAKLGAPASVVTIKLLRGDYERARASGVHERPKAPAPVPPPPSTDFEWTAARVQELRDMWAAGKTAGQIERIVGDSLPRGVKGPTRSAVLGKVHRLDLPARLPGGNPGSRKPRTPRPARAPRAHTPAPGHPWAGKTPKRAPSPPRPSFDAIEPVALGLLLTALTDQMCKWPIGDRQEDGYHFCGHRSFSALPYCEYHGGLAYQPISDRRRERDARL